jgi:hypothetical protein
VISHKFSHERIRNKIWLLIFGFRGARAAAAVDYFTQRYILAAAAVCFDPIEAICARRINLLTPSMGLTTDVHWQQSRETPECEELKPQARTRSLNKPLVVYSTPLLSIK